MVPVGKGVRQECILTTDMSSLYNYSITNVVDNDMGMRTNTLYGININGHEIYEVRYSDDTALLSERT